MGSALSTSSERGGDDDSQNQLAADFSNLSLSGARTSGNVSPARKIYAPGEYEPTVTDVFSVRHLLLHTNISLPLELIDIILNDADYWPHISIARDTHLIASSADGEWAYIVSPPMPTRLDNVPLMVKKIVFKTNSCDQGWGGEPQFTDTYHGSWTWFEVGIIPLGSRIRALDWVHERPVNLAHWAEEERHRLRLEKDMRLEQKLTRVAELKFASDELEEYDSEDSNDSDDDEANWPADDSPLFGRRWLVQRNIQVSREQRDHTVVWRYDDPVHSVDVDEENGCGRGTDFLQTLQSGDRVVLLARAMFPGWTNNVYRASMDIFYSVLV